MRLCTFSSLALSALVLGLGVQQVQAGLVEFSSHWSIQPGAVLVGTNPSNITGNGISTGSVAWALYPSGQHQADLDSGIPAILPVASLTSSSSASEKDFDQYQTPFQLTLDLAASGQHGTLTFDGILDGTLTSGTSHLTAAFVGPLTKQLTLGDHLFTVTLASLPVPVPGSPSASLDASVQVDSAVPVSNAPEPGTLTLVASGVAFVGAVARRSRGKVSG